MAGDLTARFTGAAARFVADFDAAVFARGFLATVFLVAALLAAFFVTAFLVAAFFVIAFFAAGFVAFATLRAGALAAVFFVAFTAFFAVFFAVFFVADLRAWVAMPVSGRNDVIAPSAHVGAMPTR